MGRISETWYRVFSPWISLDEVRERLGSPRSILCLGNGPSSHGILPDGHDCVLRVNPVTWGSQKAGPLDRPHALILTRVEENYRLLRRKRESDPDYAPLIFTRGRKGGRFAAERGFPGTPDAERIDMWANRVASRMPATARGKRSRPTTGMLLLSLAANLQPERLTVAGFDFYCDPRGDYPSDPRATAAADWLATGRHSLCHEIIICLHSLTREYGGRIEVKSNVLQRLLADARLLDRLEERGWRPTVQALAATNLRDLADSLTA